MRELGASRLLLNLSGVLISWCAWCSGLMRFSVSTEHLALTSDGVKYSSVAVGENADRYRVIPAEPNDCIRLRINCCLYSSFISNTTILSVVGVRIPRKHSWWIQLFLLFLKKFVAYSFTSECTRPTGLCTPYTHSCHQGVSSPGERNQGSRRKGICGIFFTPECTRGSAPPTPIAAIKGWVPPGERKEGSRRKEDTSLVFNENWKKLLSNCCDHEYASRLYFSSRPTELIGKTYTQKVFRINKFLNINIGLKSHPRYLSLFF